MKTSLRVLGVTLWLLFLAAPAKADFGLTTASSYYEVDAGSTPSLVFRIRRVDGGSTTSPGDIMSLKYNGVEFQDQSRGSQINSGFDYIYANSSAVSISATTVGSDYIKITVVCGDPTSTKVLTHYYMVHRGEARIYMATHFTSEPEEEALCRYILRIQHTQLPNGPAPSELAGNTGAIEASDVFGMADGTTRSKHYSNMRLHDWSYIGANNSATAPTAGIWLVRDNNEGNSGGPFYRSLLNQGTSDQEITYIVNYGEGQTEAFRLGILNHYTLVCTNGATPGAVDTSFFANMGLTGYVPDSGRGFVTGSGITGRDTRFAYTVGFANATAQYWTDAAAGDGSFTTEAMIPGTYTLTVYKNELAVYKGSATVAAGGTTALGPLAITADPSQAVPLWRIGNWDGSPKEFLNGDKINYMHPSDVRMSPWAPGTYTVATSSPATGFPCYQWKSVNSSQVVQFTLSASQVAASTVRVGITTAYAGGRPNITVNSWTGAAQSPSTQPDSRTLTVGTYRGNNTTYTFNVPASALVAGTNTLTVFPISGSSGTTFLSPGYSFDCIDMYQGSQTLTAPTPPATLSATGGSTQVALAWDASANATSYAVLRGTASGGPYTAVASGLATTGYADTGLTDGTPYYYVVTASNSSGTGVYSTEASATPTAAAAPIISSSLTASTQAGQAFTYQITAANSPTSFAASGLPDGLSVDAASGLISGTPTLADTYNITVSATNSAGMGTATLSLVVSPPPVAAPVIANAASLSGKAGVPFTYQISATNNPASFSADGLPDGLSVDVASGLISGTPTTARVFHVTLGATNTGGTGTASVSVTIVAALPLIGVTAAVPQVTAGSGEYGVFELTRSGDDLSATLSVAYTVKGTAVGGTDYVLLKGVKKMKPGKASVKIKVVPLGDGGGAGVQKTVVLKLAPGLSYNITGTKAKVKIAGQ